MYCEKHNNGNAWNLLAETEAETNHEKNFESRRGVYAYPELGLIVIYNNNPWTNFPGLRDEELEQLRVKLTTLGYLVVGHGSYPVDGEDKGYTRTMVVTSDRGVAVEDAEAEVADVYQQITVASHERIVRWPGAKPAEVQ